MGRLPNDVVHDRGLEVSDIARILEPLREELVSQAKRLELNPGAVEIEPVLNWGGFMNRSFRISDGRQRFFLKLTSYPEIRRGLEQWRDVAPRLETRYRAPRMMGWVDLPTVGFGGPLFEWIDGRTPATLTPDLASRISALIQDLHEDVALSRELSGGTQSCTDAYLRAYHHRFTEDLAGIAASPPPFVDNRLIEWMKHRVEVLEAKARELSAFQGAADRPIHGDLWLNNVWVRVDTNWHLLDWDGLCLSDPVIDWTMLFGPTRQRPVASGVDEVLKHARLGHQERARLDVYVEASQLDWVIDPLSDWVESEHEPEHGAAVRTANEHVHRQALEAYRMRYG